MADAHQFVDQIRRDLKPLEDRILRHQYLEMLEAGRLERADLRIFAGQQYHIITSDVRSIALMLSRHGTLPGRAWQQWTVTEKSLRPQAYDRPLHRSPS